MKTTRSSLLLLTIFLTSLLMALGTTKARAQKNYFYGSIKLPVLEYVGHLLTDQNSDKDTEGIIFDLGYGINISDGLVLETGFEAFVYNPFTKKHYGTHFSDSKSAQKTLESMLYVENKAFALQLRPVWELPMDEVSKFRIACAVNLQQFFSSGVYSTYQGQPNATVLAQEISSNSKSPFHIGFQPLIGLDLLLSENWGIAFDLQYVGLNWSRSMKNLQFVAFQSQAIPTHHTRNVFLSGRIFFK